MEEFIIPAIELNSQLDQLKFPTQEEYSYWSLRMKRVFYIDFEIEEDYALMELSKVITALNISELDIPKEQLQPIVLFVHSYGGDLAQSFYFADLIMASRIPIYTVATGAAMSAGMIIFLAGSKRFLFKHTQLLIHAGAGEIQGTADQVDQAHSNYKRIQKEMGAYIVGRTAIDEKTFKRNQKKDWYLTPEEIEKYEIGTIISSIEEIYK